VLLVAFILFRQEPEEGGHQEEKSDPQGVFMPHDGPERRVVGHHIQNGGAPGHDQPHPEAKVIRMQRHQQIIGQVKAALDLPNIVVERGDDDQVNDKDAQVVGANARRAQKNHRIQPAAVEAESAQKRGQNKPLLGLQRRKQEPPDAAEEDHPAQQREPAVRPGQGDHEKAPYLWINVAHSNTPPCFTAMIAKSLAAVAGCDGSDCADGPSATTWRNLS
jgi:hypothetical protein